MGVKVLQQELYKKMYSVKEFYNALYKGLRTYKYMKKNKKSKNISAQFKERMMLAVTEVNGCEVCSYAHTKIALEQGMSNMEIKKLLLGNSEGIPEEEMPAIVFAQHYADTKGNPTEQAWNRVVTIYGKEKALGILGIIRMIMIGNIFGIAISAFRSRLKGKKIAKSSVLYEIKMMTSIIILILPAIIHSFILQVLNTPVIDFQ